MVHGSATFFGKQVTASVGCSGYAFGFTYVMLKLIDLITPASVGAESEEGLDAAMHGKALTMPVSVASTLRLQTGEVWQPQAG
jgi:ammonia channel protein AmtB